MERRRYDIYDQYPTYAVPARDQIPRTPGGTYAGHDDYSTHKAAVLSQADPQVSDPYQHARHDSRHHYPPTTSNTGRPRSPYRSSPKSRLPWPPRPFVEDELLSLRRESNVEKVLQEVGRDEAPSRGTVDQEPLIIEVPEYLNLHERRFVLKDQLPLRTGIPTPPTSEDERIRKVRRKPSKLSVATEAPLADLSKRTSSPYAYTKHTRPTEPEKPQSSSSRYIPTDTLTPPSSRSDNTIHQRSASSSKPVSPGPGVRRREYGIDTGPGYRFDESAVDESLLEAKASNPSRKQVIDQPVSESPVEAGSLALNAPPIRKVNLDARRNTDTQNTLPTLGRLANDRSRRPTPLMASSSLSEAHDTTPLASASLDLPSGNAYARSRESSYASSRGPSPVGSAHNGATPPSRSPRLSAEVSHEGSIYGSRPPSATTSRPASPLPRTPGESPRYARPDLDWNTLLAANIASATRRTQPPSKLAGPQQREATPDRGPSKSSLPYPEDYTLMGSSISMPEENDHAYYPTRTTTMPLPERSPGNSPALSSSPGATTASRGSIKLDMRPVPTRGYSATTVSPKEPRSAESRPSRAFELKRTESFATTSETRREIAALMKKSLPPCTRMDPMAGFDDWYTVSGATNIDVCPDCILFFERTIFRSHFRRSLPRSLSDKVKCAFSSPWIRLAWLLTLQQHRTDLSLIRDVAEIEATTDPCPGAVEMVQSWYGLRDPDGLFVRDFHVCFGDVRKIERLLPTLAGIFVKLPLRASHEKRTCAIRIESNRFSAYLDALVSAHEKAIMSRKGADPMPLIDLVERKTRLRECTRDNMIIGGLWHFYPDIPSLTICEDCFESIVEPEIKKGSSVAKKFNRTVQPVYSEGIGSSCQLYSRRMRKVFQRAVEDVDLKYLSRKANERRDMELYLQDKYKDIVRKAKRLSLEGDVSEEDERRLTRDLEKISSEWKAKWE